DYMTMTVLMLQAFSGESRASRRAAHQEPATTHIASGPDQIADTLEPEHRVINKKRDRVDPVVGVRCSGGNKRRHRTGLGDALFQNLPVFGFLVIKQRVHIYGFVELANARIDSDLAE